MDVFRIAHIDDIPSITSRGGKLKAFASPKTIGTSKLVMGNTLLRPGEETIEHFHHEGEEVIFIAQGSGTVQIEGTRYPLRKGNVFLVRAGQAHKFLNDGQEDFELIFASSPVAARPESGHQDVPSSTALLEGRDHL
jgi:putative monooxygenase